MLRRGIICLLVLVLTIPVWPESLYVKPKHEIISVRLLAREQLAPLMSTARNTDWYVVEIESKSGKKNLARLIYSFLYHEARLPDAFLDYSVSHKFRAVRDKACDTTMERVERFNLRYSADAPRIDIAQSTTLPCYIVTPADYKGSKKSN